MEMVKSPTYSLPPSPSVTKIMGKTAIWTILFFSPLPPLNNVEEQ